MEKNLIPLFLILSHHLSAQNILSYFNAVQAEQTVQLTFTIDSGQTCNGIQIQRSLDGGIAWINIGEIPGICGSSSGFQTYQFTDLTPIKNYDNYYHLVLGNGFSSDAIKVHVTVYDKNGLLIISNPFAGEISISFENRTSEKLEWQLFNSTGSLKLKGSTNDDAVTIRQNDISSGVYYFVINDKSKIRFRGKIAMM